MNRDQEQQEVKSALEKKPEMRSAVLEHYCNYNRLNLESLLSKTTRLRGLESNMSAQKLLSKKLSDITDLDIKEVMIEEIGKFGFSREEIIEQLNTPSGSLWYQVDMSCHMIETLLRES